MNGNHHPVMQVFCLFVCLFRPRCAACGILVPQPEGSNPCPLHWELGVLTTGLPGKSPVTQILVSLFLVPLNKPGTYSFIFSRDHRQGLHLETKGHKKALRNIPRQRARYINLLVSSFDRADFLLYQEFIRQHITGDD